MAKRSGRKDVIASRITKNGLPTSISIRGSRAGSGSPRLTQIFLGNRMSAFTYVGDEPPFNNVQHGQRCTFVAT